MSYGGGRFGEIYAQNRGPSLLEIMQSAGLTKAQRDQREMQREQLARQDEQTKYAREQQLAEFDATQKHRQATEKLALDKQAAEQQAAEEKQLANKQRYFATLLEKNPGQSDQIMAAARSQGVEVERPISLNLPGGESYTEGQPTPQQMAIDLQGRASGALGVQKQDEANGPQLDPIGKRVILERGQQPGTPDFQRSYAELAAEEDRVSLARARAIGGDKTLPVGSVEQISDTATAIAQLRNLESSFDENVPNDGVLQQVWAKLKSYAPNSDVAIYDKEAQLAAQKAGLILEKGKLQASDFPRYLDMLTPRPGDSKETARRKLRNAISVLDASTSGAQAALGASGYKVPGQKSGSDPRLARLNELGRAALAQGSTPEQAKAKALEQYQAEGGQ